MGINPNSEYISPNFDFDFFGTIGSGVILDKNSIGVTKKMNSKVKGKRLQTNGN